MFNIDTWQEIFITIKKNKFRTTLTCFGVFWGILIFIVLVGAGRGMENGMISMLQNRTINSLYIFTEPTTLPYKGNPADRKIELTLDDVEVVKKSYAENIDVIIPRILLGKKALSNKGITGTFSVSGEKASFFDLAPKDMVSGRLISDLDSRENRKVMLIGQYLKDLFFENEEAIGSFLTCDGVQYMIVGVFKSSVVNSADKREEQRAFIPFSVAKATRGGSNNIDQIAFALPPNVSSIKMESKIKKLLKRKYQIHPDDRYGIKAFNLEVQFRKFSGLIAAVGYFVWFVSLGSLIAGILGVGNIMSIVVKERTREIGIRKALGQKPFSIINSILMESVFVTISAGYLGLMIGTLLIFAINFVFNKFNLNNSYFANPQIEFSTGLQALLIIVVAGVIAGLVPAIKAAMIQPVVALRNE